MEVKNYLKIEVYLPPENYHNQAGVMELVDMLDLGSSAARRGGSTPFTRTSNLASEILSEAFLCLKAILFNILTALFLSFMKKKIKDYVIGILTALVGKPLVFLWPSRVKKLSEQGMTLVMNNNLNVIEKLMRNEILRKAEENGEVDKLQELHSNYWRNQGQDFFKNTDNRFETIFMPDYSFIFDLLAEHKDLKDFDTLVEIGTGNGSVLNYLASKFGHLKKLVGIDLSEVQTNLNNEKYKTEPRLDFVFSDGFDWVKKNGRSNTIFVTSGGVLEYFTETRLQSFLNKVNSLGKIIFVAIEPNGIDHDFRENPNSQSYGHERSFSHNYQKLFKASGFDIWHYSKKEYSYNAHLMCFIGARN